MRKGIFTAIAMIFWAFFTIHVNAFSLDDMAIENDQLRIAYLTFDDGPSIYTEAILDVLLEKEVPGIFFVLGDNMKHLPQTDRIFDRLINEGHFIALHSMSHNKHQLYWKSDAPQVFVNEMKELQQLVADKTGHETFLCRAPYGKRGHFKPAHKIALNEANFYCVDWHVDSLDWAKRRADAIVTQVQENLAQLDDSQKEVVFLFHEYGRTAEALPIIIDYLRDEGFVFATYVEGHRFEKLN